METTIPGSEGSIPGPGVDVQGRTIIDPSENVKALNQASINALRDILDIRSYYTEREMELRADFQKELAKKEAARIDANRAQDQDSARRSIETALTAVQVLAAQAPVQADAVRAAAESSFRPVLDRLAAIEQIQYKQAGEKAQVGESKQAGVQTWVIVFGLIGAFGIFSSFIFSIVTLLYVINK